MKDAEAEMVRACVRVGLLVGVSATLVAWLLRGPGAGITAAATVAFVVAVFAVTGRSLGWAARHGPVALQAVALGGFFLRLVLYAVMILLLRPVEAVDGTVLAVTAAVALVAVLAFETRLVLTHREFWFVDASAHPTADRKERV